MRVLVIYAHPARDSFCGAILSVVLEELRATGCEFELLDLYQTNFSPVMQEQEWRSYELSVGLPIQTHVEQLRRSDGLIWIFPTWNYGLPAILKGYVDRVWKPGVAFRIDDARKMRFDQLDNVKFFIVATTFGASWLINTFCGNPSKRTIVHGLRRHLRNVSRFAWLPIYNLDNPPGRKAERYLARIRKVVRASIGAVH
jgi:NAD(P)H dehydrogenase (quinone)